MIDDNWQYMELSSNGDTIYLYGGLDRYGGIETWGMGQINMNVFKVSFDNLQDNKVYKISDLIEEN